MGFVRYGNNISMAVIAILTTWHDVSNIAWVVVTKTVADVGVGATI